VSTTFSLLISLSDSQIASDDPCVSALTITASFAALILLDLAHEGVKRGGLGVYKLDLLALLARLFGQFARAFFVEHHTERGTGLGHARETHALDGHGGSFRFYATPTVIDQTAYPTKILTAEDDVADVQRTARNEQRRGRSQSLLELRLTT
jgi:hypothetical protein